MFLRNKLKFKFYWKRISSLYESTKKLVFTKLIKNLLSTFNRQKKPLIFVTSFTLQYTCSPLGPVNNINRKSIYGRSYN